MHELFYIYVYPIIGDLGINDHRPRFSLMVRNRWGDGESGAWFGPLGCLLIVPAIIVGCFTKDNLVRFVSLLFILYVGIISLQITWMPWNGRFLGLVPACSAVVLAYFLNRISDRRMMLASLRIVSMLILIYSAIFNQEKELLNSRAIIDGLSGNSTQTEILSDNIWSRTNFGTNRQYYNKKYFYDGRVTAFSNLVPARATVGIITSGSSWVYPFYAIRPDVQFVPLTSEVYSGAFKEANDYDLDYLLCINSDCKQFEEFHELWPLNQNHGRLGVLYKVL